MLGKDKIEIVKFSHGLVKSIAKKLLENNASIVSTVGKEPKLTPGDDNSPCKIYYWDILEAAYEYSNSLSFSEETKNVIKIISSEKSLEQIPDSRKELWYELTDNEVVSIRPINPGWNAGAYKRIHQEKISDALITLGGGEGVEHLVDLHIFNGKLVLPLNICLTSSYGDGRGGSPELFRNALYNTKRFIFKGDENIASKLSRLDYGRWSDSPERYADAIIDFLKEYLKPQVFYVRLLNSDHEDYEDVDCFFRKVVDIFMKNFGYYTKEMGRGESTSGFMNIEIFSDLKKSSIVVADLTGLRANCFMEMGFAFGGYKKVILTAKKGTELPFDSSAIPCYFWDPKKSPEGLYDSFLDFWHKNINRPPLVEDTTI